MELKLMTMRSVRQDTKKGMTPGDFCEKYECSEEELKHRLQQLFNGHAGHKKDVAAEVYATMLSNKKKPRGVKKSKSTAGDNVILLTSSEDASVVVESVGVKFIPDNPISAVMTLEAAAAPAPETPADNSSTDVAKPVTLEDFRAYEQDLSAQICANENTQQELRAEQRAKIADIKTLYNELTQLATEIGAMRRRFTEISTEYHALNAKIHGLSREKDALILERDQARAKIHELNVVTLFVYDDGRIEAVDRSDFRLNDTGFIELNTRLLRKLDFDNLKVRDVRTLARAICIVQNAPDDYTISMVFESPAIESAYKDYMLE